MKQRMKRLPGGVVMAAVVLAVTVFGAAQETVLTVGVVAGSYWDAPTGNCYAVIDAAIARFEQAHPNVRVEYTSGILKRDYSEWLTGQYLLGREPDVFMVLPEDFGMLAEQGALQPLDNLLASDPAVSTEDFYTAALQSGAAGGVQYALPYECVPTLMFVNKTLLEAENIPVPDNDWTWDDFYEICAQVTRDTDGDGTIDQFGSYGYTWRDALAANGAALFDENGSSCLIAQPASVEAVRFAQRLEELYADCDITARSFDEGMWRSGRFCSRITAPISPIRGASSGIRILSGTASKCRAGRLVQDGRNSAPYWRPSAVGRLSRRWHGNSSKS